MDMWKRILPGLLLTFIVAGAAFLLNSILPIDLLGATLLALLIGMALNPLLGHKKTFDAGTAFSSKTILRLGIILMGINLNFSQVFQAGKYALVLMVFTLSTSFIVAYICGKVFKINWKLTSLLAVSTAICGGTAVATLGPTIEADHKDIAYAISATFIFDILTVLLFPWFGKLLGLGDIGYGLWIGTAVNDTSSVIAAGYAFSDAAGALATIVKLTRTLFIVPIVLIFSWIHTKKKAQEQGKTSNPTTVKKVSITKIFPWFILVFLGMVTVKSTGVLPQSAVNLLSTLSKWFLAMALGAIGLKTSFKEVASTGFKPMVAGVIIDTSVVIVALIAQGFIVKLLA